MIEIKSVQHFNIKSSLTISNLRDTKFLPYLVLGITIIGWGLSGTFINLGLRDIPSLPFLSLRFIVTTMLIIPLIYFVDLKSLLKELKSIWIWLIAIFEILGLTFQYIGFETIPAGLGTLISLLFVLLVPIFAIQFLNEKFTYLQFIGIIIALLGVVLIASNGNITNLFTNFEIGLIILLGSAFFYSFYILVSSKYTRQINTKNDPIIIFIAVIIIMTLVSTLSTIGFSSFVFVPIKSWTWIILLAIISTIIPFIGYFIAIKYIPANTVSLLLLLQVLIPLFIDVFYLQISYGVWVIFGGFLIVLAMIVVIKNSKM